MPVSGGQRHLMQIPKSFTHNLAALLPLLFIIPIKQNSISRFKVFSGSTANKAAAVKHPVQLQGIYRGLIGELHGRNTVETPQKLHRVYLFTSYLSQGISHLAICRLHRKYWLIMLPGKLKTKKPHRNAAFVKNLSIL